MQIKNVRGHRIHWRLLMSRGALVGIISASLMLVAAAIMFPLTSGEADVWSFLKIISGVVLGTGAVEPLAGFDANAVLIGLGVHYALGVLAGVTYALLCAFFDLEGWSSVAMLGLVYGVVLFVWGMAVIQALVAPELVAQIPVIVMFFGNMVFGLTSGVMLATWADDADLDQEQSERVPVFEGDEPTSHRTWP